MLLGVKGETSKVVIEPAMMARNGVLPMPRTTCSRSLLATPVLTIAIEITNPVTMSHNDAAENPDSTKSVLRMSVPFFTAPVLFPTQKYRKQIMMKILTAKLTPIVTHTATAPPKMANILCWVTLRLAIGVSQIAVPTRRENSSPHFFPQASNPPTFFSGVAAALLLLSRSQLPRHRPPSPYCRF